MGLAAGRGECGARVVAVGGLDLLRAASPGLLVLRLLSALLLPAPARRVTVCRLYAVLEETGLKSEWGLGEARTASFGQMGLVAVSTRVGGSLAAMRWAGGLGLDPGVLGQWGRCRHGCSCRGLVLAEGHWAQGRESWLVLGREDRAAETNTPSVQGKWAWGGFGPCPHASFLSFNFVAS